MTGSSLGVLIALGWWRLARILQHRWKTLEGKYLCCCLFHDFRMPDQTATMKWRKTVAEHLLAGPWYYTCEAPPAKGHATNMVVFEQDEEKLQEIQEDDREQVL